MENRYDIVFVGAGISAAYTLLHYMHELGNNPPEKPVQILVLEKSGEFWTGVPYGKQSGHNPLIITSIREFIPQQPERDHFIDWLKQNQKWVFDIPSQPHGELTLKWRKAHKVAMENGHWDDLFIPRYIFGLYIQTYISQVLKEASERNLAQITLYQATVTDIQHFDNQYKLEAKNEKGHSEFFEAEKLVLSVGSPPNIGFGQAATTVEKVRSGYITNVYEPSLDENVNRICKTLAKIDNPSQRQVLIVGSNAGTLDTLFSLCNSQKAMGLIDRFIILSPNGAFPHRISDETVEPDYTPENLLALAKTGSFTAKQILEAVENDVASAAEQKLNISDIFPNISHAMIEALNLLNEVEQEKFVSKYAVEIGKLQRRAGGEYLDVVDSLVSMGKLRFLKGRFSNYISVDEGGPGVEYTTSDSPDKKILTDGIGFVVICAGFQEVTSSTSVLIQNLIRRQICVPNNSKRGFVLNEHFETAKNCYLMGPLVAGNLNKSFRVWHAESCSRIINMSKKLAEVLVHN